jgi:hypothetical protein
MPLWMVARLSGMPSVPFGPDVYAVVEKPLDGKLNTGEAQLDHLGPDPSWEPATGSWSTWPSRTNAVCRCLDLPCRN